MWFKNLTGFEDDRPENVHQNIVIEGDYLFSKINNKKYHFGNLEIITLEDLRNLPFHQQNKKIKLEEIVADVQQLHKNIENKNALFQAASQFNLLEMVSPQISPELGISRYENDRTQGPACAIACGAGTIFRNYFVEINGKIGQTTDHQIDCLDLIGEFLKNDEMNLWTMKNGYALPSKDGLQNINNQLTNLNFEEREILKGKLKIGIQWDTEVTISTEKHRVSQIYCSALPVAYSSIPSYYWEKFSRLILEATYEATFYAAVSNEVKNNSNVVFLTLVGGGAFGNDEIWILESLEKSLLKFINSGLDIKIVSYGTSNFKLKKWIEDFSKKYLC